jgi:hypothetical protein
LWPNLEVLICWRSPMVFSYIELLRQHLGTVPQRDYILMASEGVIAIPFEDGVSGGALATSIHFYEFIPEELADRRDPPTLLAHEIEAGKNYVVVLTTSAGLYRYNIGDVVRVRNFLGDTPVLEFLHRCGRTCSMTGEKLTEDQVAESVAKASSRAEVVVQDFTVCPEPRPFPHYCVLIEAKNTADITILRRLIRNIDLELCSGNLEYRSKRESRRLGPPELLLVSSGAFAKLRNQCVGNNVSDAQVKPVRLTRDAEFRNNFEIIYQISCESTE